MHKSCQKNSHQQQHPSKKRTTKTRPLTNKQRAIIAINHYRKHHAHSPTHYVHKPAATTTTTTDKHHHIQTNTSTDTLWAASAQIPSDLDITPTSPISNLPMLTLSPITPDSQQKHFLHNIPPINLNETILTYNSLNDTYLPLNETHTHSNYE